MHVLGRISVVWATMADRGAIDGQDTTSTQLDSHANMAVVEDHATIFSRSGRKADVKPFASDCSKLESVPIVDAAVAYDCPHSMKTYILAFRNALHVPSMNHNLISPFVMREVGLIVNDVPKIHTKEQELNDETHCIAAKEGDNGVDLKIPLKLDGIFSYFPTRKLTREEVGECEYIETLHLCPEGSNWDPSDESFHEREESFTNFRGDLIDRPSKRRRILDEADVCDIQISHERYEAPVSSIVAANFEAARNVQWIHRLLLVFANCPPGFEADPLLSPKFVANQHNPEARPGCIR